MRPFLMFIPVALMLTISVRADRPVYAVRDYDDVLITRLYVNNQGIIVELPKDGGFHVLHAGPKTWFIKNGDEASFSDLRVGQHVHIRFIPRGGQAVTVEVLSPKTN